MQLDSSRNHIILVNLWLSMISISVMAATILPAFFGAFLVLFFGNRGRRAVVAAVLVLLLLASGGAVLAVRLQKDRGNTQKHTH
jgi:VIT1/CCC1 family predicted Fe2+/Mn2+ transporter